MVGVAAFLILQQGLAVPEGRAVRDLRPVQSPTASIATAVRALRPPVIDGKDDDPVWRTATAITQFKQYRPTEGKAPSFGSEAKVAFDTANLYVFVRAFDPYPKSIVRRFNRRDTFTYTDRIGLVIDSYHDRRTGFVFWVTAAGVQSDAAIYEDGTEDRAWDAVWDAETWIDSLGWSAEFRIPLSQLRYVKQRSYTFGLEVLRDIDRLIERTAWPQIGREEAEMVSRFGDLTGLESLQASRPFEATPYVVARNASDGLNAGYTRSSHATGGFGLKYRVASNLTLDATFNPDFGQVEADPAVLNLTAFETFFDEQRPFFVAGQGVFQFDVDCNDVNCNSEGLYYSRRIGRTPHLAVTYGDTTPQQPTTILGAVKLTGRLAGGLSVGFVDAVTRRQESRFNDSLKTTEPGTNLAALRLKQDLFNGSSTIGAMFTAVNRSLDSSSSAHLGRSAYVGAVDFRHRFPDSMYQVSGSFDMSRVEGSPAAIARIDTDVVHYFQRPDAGLPLDTTRTSLGGDAEELKFAKVRGAHLKFETAYQRRSAGFEVNDLGYLLRADQQSWSTWAQYADPAERKWYRLFLWNCNYWRYWSTAGLPQEHAFNTNVNVTLWNSWNVKSGATFGHLGATYDDRTARGGPAVRQNGYLEVSLQTDGDNRKDVVPHLDYKLRTGDAGHSHNWRLTLGMDVKVGLRFNGSLSATYNPSHNDIAWFGSFTDSTLATHYTFAHLAQTTEFLTLQLNYTFRRNITLQAYARPYISLGTYANVRQLSASPRAARYDDRYAAYGDTSVTTNPGGRSFKEFQVNVVFRWEYSLGSTLFLVWSEGRQWDSADAEGTNGRLGDLLDWWRLHPLNTFLVKVSHWLNW